jgi:hypothetical protein
MVRKMANKLDNSNVGDGKSPILRPDIQALTKGNDGARNIPAIPAALQAPSDEMTSFVQSVKHRTEESDLVGCSQILWFSFFFDGTGNNLDADVETTKHSNIAKLYRAHAKDDIANGK